VDVFILKELLKDGRKSLSDLAKECNLTKAAIAMRYENLEKLGIIVGSTIQYNYQKFGFGAIALLPLIVDTRHTQAIHNYFDSAENVDVFHCYTSKYNLFAIVRLKTLRDLEQIK
jgi:DNA-binding Lrp family transcriptional regulator